MAWLGRGWAAAALAPGLAGEGVARVVAQRVGGTEEPAAGGSTAPDARLPAASTLAAGGALELPACVLHLAGTLTPEVMGFLGPASTVLEQAGVAQVLISAAPLPPEVHAGPAHGAHAADGDRAEAGSGARPRGLAASVRCVAPGRAPPGAPWRRWRAARMRLAAALRESPQAAVHVHGFVAALVALRVHARTRGGTPSLVYYSPHGSASLGRLRPLGAALQWLVRRLTGAAPFDRVITCCAVESRLLPGFAGGTTGPDGPVPRRRVRLPAEVHLAESPVARCFFVQPRRPAAEPLVLAGVLEEGRAAAERVARLAVLLGDEVVRARVRWVGPVRPETAPLLRAAGIETLPVGDDRALATRMAEAWVFVAPVATTRFPLLLAQAMASRLPCVALDSAFNAALLKDGESGFLCRDIEQMLARTRELAESAPLRERLGRAARQEAARRFDEGLFRQAVLLGYGAPARRPPAAVATPPRRLAAGGAAR